MMEQMKHEREKIHIDRYILKIIAVLSMFCCHVYICLGLPIQWQFLNVIGRMAFPIYCYLLVEGFHYTSNKKKYLRRLILFAFISELPFDLAIYGQPVYADHQNVFFTLAIGLFIVSCIDKESYTWAKGLYAIAGMISADILSSDYGMFGIIVILSFYFFYRNKRVNLAVGAVHQLLTSQFFTSALQMYGALAMLPLALYNGKRGKKVKWWFYVFYPLHFLVLFCIKIIFR